MYNREEFGFQRTKENIKEGKEVGRGPLITRQQ